MPSTNNVAERILWHGIIARKISHGIRTPEGNQAAVVLASLIETCRDRTTMLAPVSEGIPFLGFRIFPSTIRLPHKGLARFLRNLHARERDFLQGDIDAMLLSRSVGSMIGHMVHADTRASRRHWFSAVVDLE